MVLLQIDLKKFLVVKNGKTLYHGHMLSLILMVKKLLECLTRIIGKIKSKSVQNSKKVKKEKRDKLYVKLKGYNNSFNSWIDKMDIVI